MLRMASILFFLVLGTWNFGDCAETYEKGKKWVEQGVTIKILKDVPDCKHRSQMKDICVTDYVGKFLNGTVFDSTYKRNQTMQYIMGNGEVIKGCEIGTMNMCKGEERYLEIPPELAYGDVWYGKIPPKSVLTFVVVMTDLLPDPFKVFESGLGFDDPMWKTG